MSHTSDQLLSAQRVLGQGLCSCRRGCLAQSRLDPSPRALSTPTIRHELWGWWFWPAKMGGSGLRAAGLPPASAPFTHAKASTDCFWPPIQQQASIQHPSLLSVKGNTALGFQSLPDMHHTHPSRDWKACPPGSPPSVWSSMLSLLG